MSKRIDDAAVGSALGLSALRDLPEVLRSAALIVAELQTNPEFTRLVTAFAAIPPADRPVLLTAIEREVDARRLSLATEDVTGQSMYPSPNARLYLRKHEFDPSRLPIDRHDMMVAMLQAMRVSALLTDPTLHAVWLGAVRDTIGHLTGSTRATVTGLLRDALRLFDDPSIPHESEP